MIYWLDCDLHGADSISDVIASGKVEHIKCPTNKAFNSAVERIIITDKAGADDLVIVDTITSLLQTTRDDAKLGTDEKIDLFEKGKSKYLDGDPNYLNVYQFAASIVMRKLKNLAGRDIRIIVLAHEDEKIDDVSMTKKRMPDVNPKLVGTLIGAASDVFRLYNVPEDMLDGQGAVKVKRDTRVLYLRGTDDFIAKYNVARSKSDALPKFVLDPTLPTLYETLGKKPGFLVVYGAPGAGKTTLAVSDVQQTTKKAK